MHRSMWRSSFLVRMTAEIGVRWGLNPSATIPSRTAAALRRRDDRYGTEHIVDEYLALLDRTLREPLAR
jgi:hypothetical protein